MDILKDKAIIQKTPNSLILFIGDSITAGNHVSYDDNIACLVRNNLKANNKLYCCINRGISGSTTNSYNTILDSYIDIILKSSQPNKIAVLCIGTNDVSTTLDNAQTIYNRWASLANSVKAKGITLWAITIPPREDNVTYNSKIIDINNLIKSSNIQSKTFDWFSACYDNEIIKDIFVPEDKVHINKYGLQILADLISIEVI